MRRFGMDAAILFADILPVERLNSARTAQGSSRLKLRALPASRVFEGRQPDGNHVTRAYTGVRAAIRWTIGGTWHDAAI